MLREVTGYQNAPSMFLCRDLSVDWGNRVGDTNVWIGGRVGGDVGACCVSGRVIRVFLVLIGQVQIVWWI